MKRTPSLEKSRSEEETVAIVGMACTFPKAPDLDTFWRNIIHKVDAVTEVPRDRWDTSRFYDPDVLDGSKIYARRGGYLDSPLAFDPAEFGIMPKAVEGGEPDQFLVLKTAADALRDAGIEPGPAHERTEFILGRGSYLSTGAFNLVQRSFIVEQTVNLVGRLHDGMSAEDMVKIRDGLLASLKPFEADTAPSVMPNITAGRVANRLGFMGPNYTIDAACASSLFAVDTAAANLLSGRSDLALAGGVHIFNTVPFLSVFCALGAMSRQDRIRPFDKNADGLLPGEGAGIVVLKRRSDAERDGNRIYALIKSVGTSSDGRGISVAAPRVEGEVLALQRAYQSTGISPATIGLIEAHGTATRVGDTAEIESLTAVFGPKADAAARHCALGTVKSMIGHAMPAAGIAGLIKTVMALHHKVLPPTLHCEEPDPKFKLDQTPFYINTETRPWFRIAPDLPRRAGVNAFGFGGVNAHVVLEEYEGVEAPAACGPIWDAALFLFSAASQADLAGACSATLKSMEANNAMDFLDFSRGLVREFKPAAHRLAIIAESRDDLAKKLSYAANKLQAAKCRKIKDVKGIYYFATPLGTAGKVAFMFPAEGSPYPNMLLDLCLHFPEVRAVFDQIDGVIAARGQKSRFLPSQFIFPATLLTPPEQETLAAQLWKVDSGLQAILAASLALNALLDRFGVYPDMVVGHSAGEYSAWIASGILDRMDLYRNQERIAAVYAANPYPIETAMAAVSGSFEKICPIVERIEGRLYISNDNCPHQVVVVGEADAMTHLKVRLNEQSILFTELPSREVHHTPLAEHQAEPIYEAFSSLSVAVPQMPIYSAISAAVYPDEPQKILDLMVQYWLKPLKFKQTVEAMYQDGARIFIEIGPGTNLSGFVDDTLRGRPYMTVAANNSRRSGVAQLCHLIGMLVAQHVPVHLAAYDPSPRAVVGNRSAKSIRAALKSKEATLQLDLGLPELRLTDDDLSVWQKTWSAKHDTKEMRPRQQEADLAPVRPSEGEPRKEQASTPKAQVMQQYMDNMAKFLALQRQIMTRSAGTKAVRRSVAIDRPLVGRVTMFEPRKRCHVQRVIDLKEDLFLLDHPFGSRASDTDDRLLPLIVTPLTLNMEIMVEAASLMLPDRVALEIKAVKANRWVEVEEQGGAALEVQAHMASDTEVDVKLFDTASRPALCAQATVVFGTQYPPSAVIEPASTQGIDPSAAERAKEIYAERWMPHGPRFQVIVGLTQTGPNQIDAWLQVPPDDNLFASIRTPRLLVNPMLLDACAQLVGYWAQRELPERFITFPAGVQSIRLFAAPPKPGDLLRCRMRIRDVNEHFVGADLQIAYASGRRWAAVQGWMHRRFELPMEFYRFWRFPREHTVSCMIDALQGDAHCRTLQCRAGYYDELNRTIWKKVIGMLYLGRAERQVYREKLAQDNGADRWLTEQIAVKDAVRLFLNQAHRLNVLPADISIVKGRDGQYIPSWPGMPDGTSKPAVSVSHTDQYAQALIVEMDQTMEQERMNNG